MLTNYRHGDIALIGIDPKYFPKGLKKSTSIGTYEVRRQQEETHEGMTVVVLAAGSRKNGRGCRMKIAHLADDLHFMNKLEGTPCSEDVARQCRFVKDALAAKKSIPTFESDLEKALIPDITKVRCREVFVVEDVVEEVHQ